MISFKQYLEESRAQERVHINPSIAAMKNLAKTAKYKTLRFVIHRNDMHVADAEHHHHQDMYHAGDPDDDEGTVHGTIQHRGGDKFHYDSYSHYHGRMVDHTAHAKLGRMEKHGMTQGKMDLDHLD